MKRSRFTEEQVAYALRQAEAGTPVGDICRQMGIAEATFYVWEEEIRPTRGERAAQNAHARGRERPAEAPGGRPDAGSADPARGATDLPGFFGPFVT